MIPCRRQNKRIWLLKQPEATITHDEENFRLIYQKKTAEPINQANKTTGATLQQINTHSVLQSSYKSLPESRGAEAK